MNRDWSGPIIVGVVVWIITELYGDRILGIFRDKPTTPTDTNPPKPPVSESAQVDDMEVFI